MKNIKEGNVTTINPRWDSVLVEEQKIKQLCLPTPRLYNHHTPLSSHIQADFIHLAWNTPPGKRRREMSACIFEAEGIDVFPPWYM